jgi:hypothetical protein
MELPGRWSGKGEATLEYLNALQTSYATLAMITTIGCSE